MKLIQEIDRECNKTCSAQARMFQVLDSEEVIVKFYVAQTGTSGLQTEWIERISHKKSFTALSDAIEYKANLIF